MPMETPSPQFVQAPAQPDEPEAFDWSTLFPKGVVQLPDVDYDPHRGKGGDYIVNDEGHRVPLHEHNKKHGK